jgi:hypothetical protein
MEICIKIANKAANMHNYSACAIANTCGGNCPYDSCLTCYCGIRSKLLEKFLQKHILDYY